MSMNIEGWGDEVMDEVGGDDNHGIEGDQRQTWDT
jgi:hypothetical protein